jgi:hypothetical protein
MTEKVFVLLELTTTEISTTAGELSLLPGVTGVEIIEGPPDILLTIQAPDRNRAIEYLSGILSRIDGITQDLRVLPVADSRALEHHPNRGKGNKHIREPERELVSGV